MPYDPSDLRSQLTATRTEPAAPGACFAPQYFEFLKLEPDDVTTRSARRSWFARSQNCCVVFSLAQRGRFARCAPTSPTSTWCCSRRPTRRPSVTAGRRPGGGAGQLGRGGAARAERDHGRGRRRRRAAVLEPGRRTCWSGAATPTSTPSPTRTWRRSPRGPTRPTVTASGCTGWPTSRRTRVGSAASCAAARSWSTTSTSTTSLAIRISCRRTTTTTSSRSRSSSTATTSTTSAHRGRWIWPTGATTSTSSAPARPSRSSRRRRCTPARASASMPPPAGRHLLPAPHRLLRATGLGARTTTSTRCRRSDRVSTTNRIGLRRMPPAVGAAPAAGAAAHPHRRRRAGRARAWPSRSWGSRPDGRRLAAACSRSRRPSVSTRPMVDAAAGVPRLARRRRSATAVTLPGRRRRVAAVVQRPHLPDAPRAAAGGPDRSRSATPPSELLRASLSARGFDERPRRHAVQRGAGRDHRQHRRVRRVGLLPEHLRHAVGRPSRGGGSSTATTSTSTASCSAIRW